MREQLNDSEQPARLTRYRSAIEGSRAEVYEQRGAIADAYHGFEHAAAEYQANPPPI